MTMLPELIPGLVLKRATLPNAIESAHRMRGDIGVLSVVGEYKGERVYIAICVGDKSYKLQDLIQSNFSTDPRSDPAHLSEDDA
jgi:hypothetical protein